MYVCSAGVTWVHSQAVSFTTTLYLLPLACLRPCGNKTHVHFLLNFSRDAPLTVRQSEQQWLQHALAYKQGQHCCNKNKNRNWGCTGLEDDVYKVMSFWEWVIAVSLALPSSSTAFKLKASLTFMNSCEKWSQRRIGCQHLAFDPNTALITKAPSYKDSSNPASC